MSTARPNFSQIMIPTEPMFLRKRGGKTWWPTSSLAADLVKEAVRLKKRRHPLQSRENKVVS